MARLPATDPNAPPLRAHPAKFTDSILAKLNDLVPPGIWLDPFAGVGKVLHLNTQDRAFVCIEIEEEWAAQAPRKGRMIVGDSLAVMKAWRKDGTRFDGIVTSPVYGNRMSDHHDARDDSHRVSYTHLLGHAVSEGSSAAMYFWTEEYKDFHRKAWKRCYQVTRPGGQMFLNVKDFYRDKVVQRTNEWHCDALQSVGWEVRENVTVKVKGMRDGENSELRVDHEDIICAVRP